MNILNIAGGSSSRLVLVLFAVAIVAALFVGKIDQDTFKTFSLMVFSFFFGMKTGDSAPTTDTTPTNTPTP